MLGVLSEQGLAGGFDVDETVITPVANAQQIFNTSAVFRILVEANDRDSVAAARRDIVAIVKLRHAGEEDITVVTQDALVSTFDTIFNMITVGLAGIAAISLVVAGVLIMNVMLVAVSQRTAEIGLLKAVGARNRQILTLFLTEATCLSLLGACVGAGARQRRHRPHEDLVPGARFRSAAVGLGFRRRRRNLERPRVRNPARAPSRGARSRQRAHEAVTRCGSRTSCD